MSEDKAPSLFSSDDEVEAFVGSVDLTGYDLSALKPTSFEPSSKDARVNMRLHTELLEAVKVVAARKECPTNALLGSPQSGRTIVS